MYADAQEQFQTIMDNFDGASDVSRGKMFGSTGLKTNGKVFAMLVKDRLVVKLPRARVEVLVAARRGLHFDPGHGRLMKEWISVGFEAGESDWSSLVQEAKDYITKS